MEIFVLYLLGFLTAWSLSALTLPFLRHLYGKKLCDRPGGLKTHSGSVPIVGGSGLIIGILGSLILIRLCTNFPSGTLHNLRGIVYGSLLIFVMGLADDFAKPRGLPIWLKLCVQATATLALIHYGVVIQTIPSPWLAGLLTFLWVVGLTNAFNLLDILDGLCITQVLICTLGLTLITLPGEYIYVNFAALAVGGAALAFLPYNYSAKRRIFLGDSGSNLVGFLLAALSLGYGYSSYSSWGCLAPLFILAVPLLDTAFVSTARILQGKNPLKGSNDHAALRLQAAGWNNRTIVFSFAGVGMLGNLSAFLLTRANTCGALGLLIIATILTLVLARKLLAMRPKP